MTKLVRLSAVFLLLAAHICAAAVAPSFTAKELSQGYADSIVLVKPHADRAATIDAAEQGEGLTLLRHFPRIGGVRVLHLRSGDTADQAISRLRATGRYEYVERDILRHARVVPNDPSFTQQWSLRNTGQGGGTSGADIGAATAWDTLHDASGVIVGIIDSGARLTHTDLAANLWTSSGGYHGINSTVASTNSSYNLPNDDDGHGTHVSGIIGAVGNNGTGISGVAWKTQLMELKFLDSSGSGDLANEVECINYAIAHSVSVINASFGGGPQSSTEFDALKAARDAGIIVVAAAGNDSQNNDVVTDYPSGYALDNIIAVAATTRNDQLDASYSNYGCGTVELGAPGTDIYSTYNGSNTDYKLLTGTSMAAPHVSGALALLKAKFPGDTYRQLINRLLRSVTPLSTLSGKVQTGGRLNLAAALATTTNRPFNDDFADRAQLSGVTVHVRSNNAGATAESGEPAHAGVTAAGTLWWTWTASGANNIRIDTSGSAYDTVLAVYTGNSLNALQLVASNDDANGGTQSALSFTSQAGATYQIAVGGKNGATGYTALSLTSPPGNDDFTGAIALSGVSVAQPGTNLNATRESGEPDPFSNSAGNSVWYRWTAPASGHFTLAAFSTQSDTTAAVYTGSSLSSLTTIASNDNSTVNSSNSDALVYFIASAGTTYYFQIDHADDDGTGGGDFVLTLTDSAWEYSASDEVTSPPAVASDGTVYFGAGSTNGYDKKIYAVTSDGATKWTATTRSTGDGIIDSAPAIGVDGTVYIGGSDDLLYALNPSNGTKKWSFTAASPIGSAPAIAADGTIYFRDSSVLYSLSPGGVKNWSLTLTGSTSDGTYSSPAVGGDGTIYVGTNAGAFYAVNPDGTQKWKFTADDDIFTSPAIAGDGTIYFATLKGTVYALSPAGSQLWSWTNTANSSITSSIALGADGTLYFAGYDHKLHALSSSGTERWAYTLGDEVRACSPAIASDGTIYIGCYDGFLYAINSDGTLQRTYATAQTIRSSPVIAGQRLYIGSADAKLHAFDLAHGALASAWPMYHQNQSRTGHASASVPAAPAITTPPVSQSVAAGASASFTVAATGASPLNYQWFKNGAAIAGATSASYQIAAAQAGDAGTYAVTVTNSAGSATSSPAALTVTAARGAPAITSQPANTTVVSGGTVSLSASASSGTALSFQWQLNGHDLAGATGGTLALSNLTPAAAGIYTAAVTNTAGTTITTPAIVGVTTTKAVEGDGSVVGANIVHPNGNLYDQVLLQGSAAAVTTVPGHVTRISFIDLADNIVQVEFAGHGTLSLLLDDSSGPAAPLNYNQPDVAYMKGHAHLVIAGADETTNISVFSVGRATAFDPTGAYNFLLPISSANNPANNGSPLFAGHESTQYGGIAGIASIAVLSTDGKFGGIRTANAGYFASAGLTGVLAPEVQLLGPLYLGNLDAFDAATPVLQLGSTSDARITGGDLFQDNGAAVQVSGLTQLQFTAGSDSQGNVLPAQANRAVLEQQGEDVTSQVVHNPTP
ncbi:MAG TPA: PQQ-binding-like beta-propeller repeat protein [Opitutus sp.]|nr:PQQ-binding-like beta-propeller repeat protein [Opitutus sp.]